MSLDTPQKNKMMTAPIAKKGFHFASNGNNAAYYVEAETLEEARNLYEAHFAPSKQSTASPAKEPEENAVQ